MENLLLRRRMVAPKLSVASGQLPLTFTSRRMPLKELTRYGKCEQNGTPTPSDPVDIVCNNGELKLLTSATGTVVQDGTPTPTNPIYPVFYKNGNLVLRKVGDYADTYDQSTKTITRNVGVKVLDGTETWLYTWSSSNYVVNFQPDNIINVNAVLSNSYVMRNDSTRLEQNDYGLLISSGYIFIKDVDNVGDGVKTRIAKWTQFLANQYAAGTPVTIYYPLETPITESFTDNIVYADGTQETINVHGKNLFDINSVMVVGTGYTVTAVGNNIEAVALSSTLASSRINIFIPVSFFKENTTYYFNSKSDTSFNENRCAIGKATPSSSSGLYYYGSINQKDNNGYSDSFTITDIAIDQEYVSIFYYLGEQDVDTKITISDIQIEQGLTATAYEPYYNGGTAAAEMLLSVGDYRDMQDVLSGVVNRNIGVKVFTGANSEGWSKSADNVFVTDTFILDALQETHGCLSTHYQGIDSNQPGVATGSNKIKVGTNVGQSPIWGRIIVYADPALTLEDFKAYLAAQFAAGTPVIVVYPLATQTTEQVTPQEFNSHAGTIVVDTECNVEPVEANVKYYK